MTPRNRFTKFTLNYLSVPQATHRDWSARAWRWPFAYGACASAVLQWLLLARRCAMQIALTSIACADIVVTVGFNTLSRKIAEVANAPGRLEKKQLARKFVPVWRKRVAPINMPRDVRDSAIRHH